MPWYFLPKEHVAPEMSNILAQVQVPAMDITIAAPRTATGLAFQSRAEHLAEVLGTIGLGHCTFTMQPTDQDGVLMLELAPDSIVRPDPAGRFVDTADAFVAHIRTHVRQVREENELLAPKFRQDIARLEGELYIAAARLRDLEEQLAVRAATDTAADAQLRADFGAIGKDSRVTSVGSTASQLIIETRPLALATSPRRFLGRFRLVVGLTDADIRVEALDKVSEYPHPNVSIRGVPYLGAHRDGLVRRLAKFEYAKVVRMLLDFLEEPPTGELTPAMRPDRWPELPTTGGAPAPTAAQSPADPVVTVLHPAATT
ncbi:hypothetical protein HY480_02545 [Candidatus Uhrbacteria bacterium]|nr:hypothetical protein [Candidatus Uhrbacteria bacterium]